MIEGNPASSLSATMLEKGKFISTEINANTHKFINFIRTIDYYFQSKRTKIFINEAFIIVLIAPLIDYVILPKRLSLTSVATYIYLGFFLVSSIAWLGKFRDENNKWSYKRCKERLRLSLAMISATVHEIKKKDANSRIVLSAINLFIAGFVIKAFQNISEIFRIPFNYFGIRMNGLRTFESYSNLGFILIFTGAIILLYLHFKKRLDIFDLLFKKGAQPHQIQLNLSNDFVVHTKNKEQISNIVAANPDFIFRATVNALIEWNPRFQPLEEDYELDLQDFLTMKLFTQGIKVATQYTIKTGKETGRVDISVNESLFIEMKRKVKSAELDRASGQVLKYQRLLQDKTTPLILLIIDTEYESLKNRLTDFIRDYNQKHKQKLLAIVVTPL